MYFNHFSTTNLRVIPFIYKSVYLFTYKSMFTWEWKETFHFGVWSISYNCLHDTTRNETHCGHYFSVAILTKNKFRFGWWNIEIIRNHMKENICTWLKRMIDFYWTDCLSQTTPETRFHFILPAMKSNVNRIFFMVGWNLISGRFHLESHVNTL